MKENVNIKEIDLENLYQYQEGLVIQGCGGDLQEWVDGITNLLIENQVLQKEFSFPEVATFQHNQDRNILFPLDHEGLNMMKLIPWRLENREKFGAVWLSDYKPNTLEQEVPEDIEEDLDR